MISKSWLTPVMVIGWLLTADAAPTDELLLMEAPVKVTATLRAVDEGGFDARIAVHNGPVAQLVNTTLNGLTPSNAAVILRPQLHWRAPYLLVRSSCNVNTVRRCGGDVVFKIVDNKVIRLGDFVVTENSTYSGGRFYDGYDKLGEQVQFVIVMMDMDDSLVVDANGTWQSNAAVWKIRTDHIAGAQPSRDWSEVEWAKYFDAIINNAALARYCNHNEELQQLLDAVNPLLDTDHRRLLADMLSKVNPLEKPRAWRKAY